MFIKLDFEADEPIYTQLKQQIIAGIAKGDLVPGEALPSVRAMAADIGINLHTVNKVYQQLKQEGFILIHRQKGVVINPEGVSRADAAYYDALNKKISPLIAESICRGVDRHDFLTICDRLYDEFQNEKE